MIKNKWIKGALLVFTTTGLFINCTKEDRHPEDNRDPQFYYVGYSYNERYQEQNRHAILVIGDSIVQLSPNNRSDALAIYVYNNAAHITGYQHGGTDRRAAYWKDDQITHISGLGSNNAGTAILATDNQVLIGGDLTEEGRTSQYLWINEVPHRKAGSLAFSGIKSIAVDNGRIFLAGDFAQRATMWDDQDAFYALPSNAPASGAEHIAFRDGEPYVIGWEYLGMNSGTVTVWKNREKIFTNTLDISISSITALMDGFDYYYTVNSYEDSRTSYVYKNDNMLYQLSTGQEVITNAIRIHNGKVYVLGQILEGSSSTPTLWIDGQPHPLFSAEDKIYLHDFFIY